MSRTMGDSTNLTAIPPTVNIAAVYASGGYTATTEAVEARFPHAKYGRCWIDALGTRPDAQMRDWEPGNETDSDLQGWVISHNKISGKKDAVIYSDRADLPQVRQLTGTQILGTDYFLLVSTLDGTVVTAGPEHLDSPPYTYPGVIGCQVKGANLTGGDWDMSLIYDGSLWLPVAPPKPPAPRVTRAQGQAALGSIAAALGVLTVGVTELPE